MFKYLHKRIQSLKEYLFGHFEDNSSKGQLFKGGVGSLLINFGNKFLVLISGMLLVRILGKEHYGIYSYVLSLIFVLIIPAEFGISTLIVRETSKGLATRDQNSITGIWRWSLRITLLLCLTLILLSSVGMIWGVQRFSNLEITTFIWALSLMPFQALILIISAALRGMKNIVLGQLADLIILPGIFILLFLVVYLVSPILLTASTSMALRSVSTLIAFIFCLIFLIKKTPQMIRTAKPKFQGRYWAISALPLGLSSGLGMVKSRITTLLLGFFVSANQIGTFQVAISTAALAGLVLQANDAVLAPQFASLYVQNKKIPLQRLVTINSRIIFAFNLGVTLIFILFGKSLLSIVFGPDLVDAYPSVIILLAGQLVNSLVGSVVFLLNMTGHENDVMKVIGISSLANVIMALSFSPFLGINGGAISTSVSLIIAQIVMANIVRRRLGIVSHAFHRTHSNAQ
ncbi:MAG: oligosaccharide flippase family protein [Anaerolineaceae bacterium]|nr:oligosaccharide flippase family protein [Anaerolineaceae bacterium]